MASAFINVNIVNVLLSKYTIKFILKCTSHGGMYNGRQFGKISISVNVKTANVVTRICGRLVGYISLSISRCCSESILMKVSNIYVIYNMKISFKKNSVEPF